MKGAIVFLAAFLLFIVITLGYPALPPGQMIYDAAVGAETDYLVIGIPATTLAVALFNGVIWGFIVYLVFWLAEVVGLIPKREKKITIEVKKGE